MECNKEGTPSFVIMLGGAVSCQLSIRSSRSLSVQCTEHVVSGGCCIGSVRASFQDTWLFLQSTWRAGGRTLSLSGSPSCRVRALAGVGSGLFMQGGAGCCGHIEPLRSKSIARAKPQRMSRKAHSTRPCSVRTSRSVGQSSSAQGLPGGGRWSNPFQDQEPQGLGKSTREWS